MKLGKNDVNTFQMNFVKELIGEAFTSEVRVSHKFTSICEKYGVDQKALLDAINKNFVVKNEEFKKKEAEELGLN